MSYQMVEFDFENTFNAEEYLYFYESFLTPQKLREEIGFLTRFTELEAPLHILDLACGHGRHVNALSQLGHHVTGIDSNEGFLERAKRQAERQNIHPLYIKQDMRESFGQQKFDRVFCLYTAIGYFDDLDNEKVFQNVFSALKDHGIFCFDSHNRDTFMTYFLPSSVVEKEGNFMIDQRTFDSLTGRCHTRRTVVRDGSSRTFPYSVRFYNPTEMTTLLTKIGFSQVDFYESWEGKSLGQESKRMIVVAKK